MEADRSLLNPFFEGYKLSFDRPVVDYFPLENECMKNEKDHGNVEFQVLADKIYENKLAGDAKGHFYYLDKEGNLVSFSKETRESLLITGPFECFGVEKDVIFAKKRDGKFLTITEGQSTSVDVSISSSDVKVLAIKQIKDSNETHVLLQSMCQVKDLQSYTEKYEKSKEKTAFCFYKVVLKADKSASVSFLGWSLSRPLVSFIRETGEIILGTSTGIVTADESESSAEIVIDRADTEKSLETGNNVFDSEDEDDSDDLNYCRMIEFGSEYGNNFKYPEFKVSGTSVNDLQVAAKYLHDVVIFDLSSRQPIHLTTFPAINFIQSGKIDKKFSVFGKEYAFIVESGGNVYCYAKAAGKEPTSPQYLVQLNEEVLGWSQDCQNCNEFLFILTKANIYRLAMK